MPRKGVATFTVNMDSRHNIGLRLSIVAKMLRHDFDSRITGIGITRSQWSLIAVVASRPGATQRQIAEIMEMSEASAGRLIDRLCADGLLERRDREDDRRVRSVFITEASKPLLERLTHVANENEKRVFRNFSEEELDTLRSLLSKLYENLNCLE